MPQVFGYDTQATNMPATVQARVIKEFIQSLRAGLSALPRGAVVPAKVTGQQGKTYALTSVSYPDIAANAITYGLTEGSPPAGTLLGVDVLTWAVEQSGAWAAVSDRAQFQSQNDLFGIATEKIKRLALVAINKVAMDAINAVTVVSDVAGPLSTDVLLDVKTILQNRSAEEIPGVGYYCLTSAAALQGLEREAGLNEYRSVVSEAANGDLTAGSVSKYLGFTFVTSPLWAPALSTDPHVVAFLSKSSLAAGDVGTLSAHFVTGATRGDELAQIMSVGAKFIFGAAALHFANEASAAGVNAADVERIVRITVQNGGSGTLL